MTNFSVLDLAIVSPEILIMVMGSVVLIADVYLRSSYPTLGYRLSVVTLFMAIALIYLTQSQEVVVGFSGSCIRDPLGDFLKALTLSLGIVFFIYSREYLIKNHLLKAEFLVLSLFGILGAMIMISSASLLVLYLGLELLALSLYGLVTADRSASLGAEAGAKYFVLGAVASGILLYGISMLYGATGSLSITEISSQLGDGGTLGRNITVLGIVFVIAGLAFKLGAFPFHLWVPDVYQGAPLPVALYVSSVPKLAAFVITFRVLTYSLEGFYDQWKDLLIILSVLSIIVGNIVAVAQSNIRRMLAYSTISHVGFILLGFIAGTTSGYSSALFYTIIYSLTTMAAFGIIVILSDSLKRVGEIEEVGDLVGLNQRSPWFAFLMLIVMLSLAGVPPTVGFIAKFYAIASVVQAGFVWLAVLAVLMSVVGAFFYLRIIKIMYFDRVSGQDGHQDNSEEVGIAWFSNSRTVVSGNVVLLLILGISPSALMGVCVQLIS